MTTTAQQLRTYSGPALFSFGFRPFFLLGALWAALAVPFWMLTYMLGPGALPFETGLAWHIHEMVFGYGSAIVAGFLLTAVPSWTGRLPVSGLPLGLLVLVWIAGRLAYLLLPGSTWIAALIESSFLILFAGVVWREVVTGKNTRNVKVAAAISVLAIANAGFHVLLLTSGGLPQIAIKVGLATLLFLILLIGGRIVPSFTRNWLAKRDAKLPMAYNKLDNAILVISFAALAAWAVFDANPAAGFLMALAGGLNLLRLARWRGLLTLAEPLVVILHIGYAWAAISLLLLGLGDALPEIVPPLAGIHAAGAGAIGVMTLAVMTRATLGHTGNTLTAGHGTVAVYLLVNLAAVLRVSAIFLAPALRRDLTLVASVLWCGAFLAFCLVYGPRLLKPRQPASS